MNLGRTLEQCRMCESKELYQFLDLGFLPPADRILSKEDMNHPEIHFPLRVAQCKNCGLTQLTYATNPEILYGETYSYESSITETGKKHFFAMADAIIKRFNLSPGNLAIDIGSNVGVLLEGFKRNGISVLGIDAAPRIVHIANNRGIETWQGFFNKGIAEKIVRDKGKAKVITATNVFAHLDDKKEFMESVQYILDEKGVFIIEAPYLVDLFENLEYDTIYLDHLEYLSLKPLVYFFKKYTMEVFDVERTAIHGNSIRVFVSWKNRFSLSDNVNNLIDLEESKKIYQKEYLDNFAQRVEKHRIEFTNLLTDLKKQGKKIVGISAPAKGNTLLNYCKIHNSTIDYMVEKSVIKRDHYTPGMHIPIIAEEKLLEDNPDYGIIFAWNFADEIMKNDISQQFLQRGGKFIIPIPHPTIVGYTQDFFGAQIKKIDPVFMDERGVIADLINEPINHVGLITSEKNAVRGSHYHKKSKQYSYILSGIFEVTLAPFDQPTHLKKVLVHAGELITIPPLIIHQFKAVERAVMINMESESRADNKYEEDTIRIKIEYPQ